MSIQLHKSLDLLVGGKAKKNDFTVLYLCDLPFNSLLDYLETINGSDKSVIINFVLVIVMIMGPVHSKN